MRRTSFRKAALNKAKLAKSIARTHQQARMRLMEALETRTLMTVLPAPIPGTPILLPGQSTATDHTPSVAIDLNNPQHMAAVWQVDDSFIKGAVSNNGGVTWATLAGLPTAANQLLIDPNVNAT